MMRINTILMTMLLMTGITLFSCSKETPVEDKVTTTPTPVPTKDLVGISIKSLPLKTVYALDEKLDLNGLTIEGKYTDNTKAEITVKPEDVSGFKSDKAADELVLTVTIGKFTLTFPVKVLPIKIEDGVLTQVVGPVTEIALPSYVKAIGEKAFIGSPIRKITLNEGLTSIGEEAFGWSEIEEINFPKTLTNIGVAAFYSCKNLKVIDLSNTSMKKIVHESFSYCGTAELKLPVGLKEIEYQAFIDSKDLKTLTLPEGLLILGNEAFRETGIVTLRMPNSVCSMDQRVFYHASDLEVVETYGTNDINNTEVEFCRMEASVFGGCRNLRAFAIPRGVKIIGQNTLSESPNLTTMVLPSTVEQINFNAFGNSSLKSVVIEGTVPAKANMISTAWYGFPNKIESIKVPAGTAASYKAAPGWSGFAKVITE